MTKNDGKNGKKNRSSISIRQLLLEKKKLSTQEEKLKNMRWAMGLEHETQYYFINKNPHAVKADAVVCLTWEYFRDIVGDDVSDKPYYKELTEKDIKEIDDLYAKIKSTDEQYNRLLDSVYEETGRKCGGKVVLNKLYYKLNNKYEPLRMPEFITNKPFSTFNDRKDIGYYVAQLNETERTFEEYIVQHPMLKRYLKQYDLKMIQYPFGMSSNIRILDNYFNGSSKLSKKTYTDYCGSFHYTITLPHENKETYTEADEKKFVDNHYNFGAMFQWIEPLLLASYFSCDQNAVGTTEKRIRGSFRVARVGWGNFAGADMRKKTKGVGRYADVKQKWREGFDFYESNIINYCNVPFKSNKETAMSSFSSNIRTFAPSKNSTSKERISGAPMTIPNGMEIRIFDHFPTLYLYSLLQIIILVAANSQRTTVDQFVYEDNDWIATIRKIMLEGWKAEVSPIYVKKLEKIMKLEGVKLKSYQAFDVLCGFVEKLFEVNKSSDYVFLMYGPQNPPQIPKINKFSWDFAFMLKLLKDEACYGNFLRLLQKMTTSTKVEDIHKFVIECMGNSWDNNWKDIMYFLDEKKLIHIKGDKYDINVELMKSFVGIDNIKMEIQIQSNLQNINYDEFKKEKKIGFFHADNIKERYSSLVPKGMV
jgi:RNA binding exosome subunit